MPRWPREVIFSLRKMSFHIACFTSTVRSINMDFKFAEIEEDGKSPGLPNTSSAIRSPGCPTSTCSGCSSRWSSPAPGTGRANAALLAVRLDDIVAINDRHGRASGDEAIRAVADVLQGVRAGAGREAHHLFKLGGPLFGYYLPEAGAPEARALAEEIHEKVQQSEAFLQRLTVSVGVVNFYELFLEDGSREQMALRIEQIALYRLGVAGRQGGNTVCDSSQTSAARVAARPTVLLVDPDPGSMELLIRALEAAELTVRVCPEGESALAAVEADPPSRDHLRGHEPAPERLHPARAPAGQRSVERHPLHPGVPPQERGPDPQGRGAGHPALLPQARLPDGGRGPGDQPGEARPLMRGPWGAAELIFVAVLLLDAAAALLFVARRWTGRLRQRREARARSISALAPGSPGRHPGGQRRFLRRHRWLFLRECARASEGVRLPEDRRAALSAALEAARVEVALLRDLHAASRWRRMRAASYLPLLGTRTARVSLIHAMEREASRSVKLFLAAAPDRAGRVAGHPHPDRLPGGGAAALPAQPVGPARRVRGGAGRPAADPPRPSREGDPAPAGPFRRPLALARSWRSYLLSRVDSPDLDIAHAAFRALCAAYPGGVDHARFLAHEDLLIRNLAAESLGAIPTVRSLSLLFNRLEDPLIRKSVVLAVTAILRARPQHFRSVMLRCLNEKREAAHAALLDVLANYVDYLAEKLLSPDSPTVERILTEIIRHGHVRQIINFLNRNRNPDIEGRALRLLKDLLRQDRRPAGELVRYLDPRLLAALGLQPPAAAPRPPPARRERPNLPLLAAFLVLGVALVPALCLLFGLGRAGAAQAAGRAWAPASWAASTPPSRSTPPP